MRSAFSVSSQGSHPLPGSLGVGWGLGRGFPLGKAASKEATCCLGLKRPPSLFLEDVTFPEKLLSLQTKAGHSVAE